MAHVDGNALFLSLSPPPISGAKARKKMHSRAPVIDCPGEKIAERKRKRGGGGTRNFLWAKFWHNFCTARMGGGEAKRPKKKIPAPPPRSSPPTQKLALKKTPPGGGGTRKFFWAKVWLYFCTSRMGGGEAKRANKYSSFVYSSCAYVTPRKF